MLILLISCGTSKNLNTLPSLDFPDFPIDPDIIDYTVKQDNIRGFSEITLQWKYDETKKVVLPFWFYEELIGYEIDIHKVQQQYNYLRNNYCVSTISELQ